METFKQKWFKNAEDICYKAEYLKTNISEIINNFLKLFSLKIQK